MVFEVASSTMVRRIGLILVLVGVLCGLVLFTSPTSWYTVGPFIISIAVLGYTAASTVLPRKRAILIAIFFGGFVALNVLIGFDLFNTFLLLCFIIGIDRLLA